MMNKYESSALGSGLFATLGVLYGIKKGKGFWYYLLILLLVAPIGGQIGWAIGSKTEEQKELEQALIELAKQQTENQG